MSETSPHGKSLLRVMMICSSLGLGGLLSAAFSMKDFFHGDAALHFSYETVIGFVLGMVLGWLFWRLIGKKIGNDRS